MDGSYLSTLFPNLPLFYGFRSGGRPAVFRYYNLLAPVLGDGSVCANVDSTADNATLQPLIDKDCDMCRLKTTKIIYAVWVVTHLNNCTLFLHRCYVNIKDKHQIIRLPTFR